MNNEQIHSAIRQFDKVLGNKVSTGSVNESASLEESIIYQSPEDFIQQLTEAGSEQRLVFMRNTTIDFESFLKQLNFPVLTFYQTEGGWVPFIIQLDRKLRPEGWLIKEDGAVAKSEIQRELSSYYKNEEGAIIFLTAFPYQSVVGESNPEKKPSPMSRLLHLLKVEKRDIGFLYIYALAVGLVGLALPLGTQAIIGFISGGMWLNTVVLLIAVVMIAMVVGGGLQIMQLSMVEVIQRRIFANTAFEFAFRIPRMQTQALLKQYTPELVNRFFDVMTLQKGLPTLLISLLTAIIQIGFSLVLLSFYHPFFVFFGLSLIALLAIIFYLTGPKGQASALAESKHKYKVASWLEELARNLNVFKLAGATQMPIQRVNREIDSYLVNRKAHFGVLIQQFSFIIAFKTLVIGGLLVLGAFLVIERQITLGQFVAAELIVVLVIGSVESIIYNMDTVYDMLAAVDKIGQVTDVPLEEEGDKLLPDTAQEKGLNIDIQNLSFRYPGSDEYALKNLNLKIKQGDRISITGFNSSGKSTLLNILDGTFTNYQGVVTYNDVSLHNLNQTKLRELIGSNLSQEAIIDGTILDNVTLGTPHVTRANALEALRAVGALNEINRFTEGLMKHLLAGGKNISHGLKSKIILARSIAKKPKVLILTNFFQFFSESEQHQLIQYLTDPKHDWTLIIASSDPMVLSKCSRIIILQDGEKLAEGDYEALKDHPFFHQHNWDERLLEEVPC